MLEGSLLGEGGARKAAGCGLGARFLAGEKCCCSVLNAGFLNNGGSIFADCGLSTSVVLRLGGGRAVEDEVVKVDDDLVRTCPVTGFGLAENEVADVLRACLDVVIGGLDRSFLTGSNSGLDEETVDGFLIEEALCSPPVEALLVFARGGGGRIERSLLITLLALGGRAVVEVTVDALRVIRVEGFTGSRLGD